MQQQRARRTKIVCTLGPASETPEAIAALVAAGMDIARLNFSHGTREEHAAIYGRVREASDAARRAVGILVDLQGPKIRLGCFDGGYAVLEPGSVFTVRSEGSEESAESLAGSNHRATTTYDGLATDLGPGDTMLIDDGMIKLQALSTDGIEVSCQVIEGGLVSDHKGINLPGVKVSAPALTEKDAEDLRFALALGVDMLALSFARRAEDAEVVRRAMDAAGRRVPVIAKLENGEGIDNLPGIVEAFDGIMVARGDLGVEVPMDQVPLIQKRTITMARRFAKPAIVATQMLESMRVHSRPTRAEVSDVANAVLDGADALMLSAETSIGEHAEEAVATMARIISATEAGRTGYPVMASDAPVQPGAEDAIAAAAVQLAQTIGASAIVAFTQSGATARRITSYRPSLPVLAFTPEAAVRSRLALSWGVETFVAPLHGTLEEMVNQVGSTMLECDRIRWGDTVVIVAGSLPGRSGGTDMIRVLHLGSPGDLSELIPA